ncbi:MAG: YcaQ family DNA glycosylase [Desulfosarcina sp.]|nr:YcaQ family DNA glycosylase [Desulfobacterales bacterium]
MVVLYPVFAFRRKAFRHHPWWGDLIGQHPRIANDLRRRVREDGPLRSLEMDGRGSRGWWDLKLAKRVATALWSAGELAIRARCNFQRVYDLTERVIPARWRKVSISPPAAIEVLLLQALRGHGWASTATLLQTWRLHKLKPDIEAALQRLAATGAVVPCALVGANGRKRPGWLRSRDFELAARLKRVRPRRDRGVLLSPFDPVLWDRRRVLQLFQFDQVLEIFKPAARRIYGYYCLPVLAGEKLVARFDLKAERRVGRLQVLSIRFEAGSGKHAVPAADRQAARFALRRLADALALKPVGRSV